MRIQNATLCGSDSCSIQFDKRPQPCMIDWDDKAVCYSLTAECSTDGSDSSSETIFLIIPAAPPVGHGVDACKSVKVDIDSDENSLDTLSTNESIPDDFKLIDWSWEDKLETAEADETSSFLEHQSIADSLQYSISVS